MEAELGSHFFDGTVFIIVSFDQIDIFDQIVMFDQFVMIDQIICIIIIDHNIYDYHCH